MVSFVLPSTRCARTGLALVPDVGGAADDAADVDGAAVADGDDDEDDDDADPAGLPVADGTDDAGSSVGDEPAEAVGVDGWAFDVGSSRASSDRFDRMTTTAITATAATTQATDSTTIRLRCDLTGPTAVPPHVLIPTPVTHRRRAPNSMASRTRSSGRCYLAAPFAGGERRCERKQCLRRPVPTTLGRSRAQAA